MQKKVLVLLAEGFEEVEAVTPIDYLRRVGIEVTTAAIGVKSKANGLAVKGARGIEVNADVSLEELLCSGKLSAVAWDGVVVPGGGPGADNLAASGETGAFLKEMAGAGKWGRKVGLCDLRFAG